MLRTHGNRMEKVNQCYTREKRSIEIKNQKWKIETELIGKQVLIITRFLFVFTFKEKKKTMYTYIWI